MALILFKALADETRLRLCNILLHYELSVNELVHILGMGQSRISRHLKILTEAGLARFRRDGLWVFYSTPTQGREHEFLTGTLPFVETDPQFAEDLEQAARQLEERASKTRQFFNDIAENWDDLNHEILNGFNLAEKVIAAMPENCGTAVDLGCGTGGILASILPAARLAIGVDNSQAMLKLCANRLAEAENSGKLSLRIGELSHLPLADHEADFACINLALHHLPKPVAAFGEIRRILAPGGILFIADFIRHDDESMRLRFGDYWLGFEPDEIIAELASLGFVTTSSTLHAVGNNLSLFLLIARGQNFK